MNAKVRRNRKRLPVLANFLESTVRERLDGAKFNLNGWGRTSMWSVPSDIEDTSECGFVGCAVGWAYYCPAFVQAGIRKLFYVGKRLDTRPRDIAEFFGVEFRGCSANHDFPHRDCEFSYCFMPSTYPTLPQGKRGINTVVRRLREVAAR